MKAHRPEVMNIVLENFLLYGISDDWAPLSEFEKNIRTPTPSEYSRQAVLEEIRKLLDKGDIRAGAFPGGGRSWEPWEVPAEEAIQRIARGFNGVPGYLDISEEEIGSSEVFRAEITERGRSRLQALGDPYENYGDPWYDDPTLNAREWGYPPFHPSRL